MSSNTPFRLIVEQPTFDLERILVEENSKDPGTMYIRGPYFMAERKNRNGRIYPLTEAEPDINRWLKEMVETKRSLGELNHPTSAEINPERACHLVSELNRDGNFYVGKSKILRSPLGEIVRNMLLDDVTLGVSSRALGRLTEDKDRSANIVSKMHLVTFDVVADPSVDTAFVQGILESKQWILNTHGDLEESFVKFENGIATLPKHDPKPFLKQLALQFIADLGSK